MSLKPGPTSHEGSRHLPMYFLSPAPPLTTVAFSSLGTKVLYLPHILLQYQSAPRLSPLAVLEKPNSVAVSGSFNVPYFHMLAIPLLT